jgi:hypothetical protein
MVGLLRVVGRVVGPYNKVNGLGLSGSGNGIVDLIKLLILSEKEWEGRGRSGSC